MEATRFRNCVTGLFVGLMILGACPGVGFADQATLTSRAEEVSKLICENPGGYDKIFAPSFLSAVPEERLTGIFKEIYSSAGSCTAVKPEGKLQKSSGSFAFVFKDEGKATVQVSIDAEEPHLVTGFFMRPIVHPVKSFDELIGKFKALPGTSSLLCTEIDGAEMKPVAQWNQDQPLALGSAFKLYVLATLVDEIEKGNRHWEDVVHLTEESKSLPSGFLQAWPVGSPITLHTLASLMISQSDNTAADSLIRLLGRRNVEGMLKPTGQGHPELNEPFLTTLEMFKIKGDPEHKAAEEYAAASADGRRSMLDGPIARMKRESIAFPSTPTHISDIEWFASATDLARVMVWLKVHSEKGPTELARGVLSINPGLQLPAKSWKYIGYKGGSEPGVLDLTFLLESATKPGKWFVITATWNDPKHEVNESTFFDLLMQASELTSPS